MRSRRGSLLPRLQPIPGEFVGGCGCANNNCGERRTRLQRLSLRPVQHPDRRRDDRVVCRVVVCQNPATIDEFNCSGEHGGRRQHLLARLELPDAVRRAASRRRRGVRDDRARCRRDAVAGAVGAAGRGAASQPCGDPEAARPTGGRTPEDGASLPDAARGQGRSSQRRRWDDTRSSTRSRSGSARGPRPRCWHSCRQDARRVTAFGRTYASSGFQRGAIVGTPDRGRQRARATRAPPGCGSSRPATCPSSCHQRPGAIIGVPAAPYFVYLEDGRVHGEGSASGWKQIISLLRDAIYDRASARGGDERTDPVDRVLSAAGIGPGHQSLYPAGRPGGE